MIIHQSPQTDFKQRWRGVGGGGAQNLLAFWTKAGQVTSHLTCSNTKKAAGSTRQL